LADKTIIYITANRIDTKLGEYVKKKLLCADLPIISVSQKAMQFGTNICVNNIGHNEFNVYKQMLIGVEAAKTQYVIWAEDDCLYPPCHFEFTPIENDVIYFNKNIWKYSDIYLYKGSPSICTIHSNRENLLFVLNDSMKNGMKLKRIRDYKSAYFKTCPVVSIIHSRGMHKQWRGAKKKRERISFWPDAKQLKKEIGL